MSASTDSLPHRVPFVPTSPPEKAPGNPLAERVTKLRGELAQAEDNLRADLDRRRAEIDEEARAMGLAEGSRKRKPSGAKICGACGKAGHNARTCPDKKK